MSDPRIVCDFEPAMAQMRELSAYLALYGEDRELSIEVSRLLDEGRMGCVTQVDPNSGVIRYDLPERLRARLLVMREKYGGLNLEGG
jgi:hypothetical protein